MITKQNCYTVLGMPMFEHENTEEISLEYIKGKKRLSLFFRNNEETIYLKSWGANIFTDTEDGTVYSTEDLENLANWIK